MERFKQKRETLSYKEQEEEIGCEVGLTIFNMKTDQCQLVLKCSTNIHLFQFVKCEEVGNCDGHFPLISVIYRLIFVTLINKIIRTLLDNRNGYLQHFYQQRNLVITSTVKSF